MRFSGTDFFYMYHIFLQKSNTLQNKMKHLYFAIPACLLIAVFFSSCQLSDLTDQQPAPSVSQSHAPVMYSPADTPIPGQYIVVFKDQTIRDPHLREYPNDAARGQDLANFGKRSAQEDAELLMNRERLMHQEVSPMLRRNGLAESCVKSIFTGRIKGAVMSLSAAELGSMEADQEVAFIEQDRLMSITISPDINTPFMPSQIGTGTQIVPYGINRVGGSVDFTNSPYLTTRWAWIVDTGIDMYHPDLNVDVLSSVNFTNDASINDEHGHGTHVAGIVAATNDGNGVSGVAAGAVVVAIKVLKNNGYGTLSDLIAGLNYVGMMAWPEDVINVSLGGSPSAALDNTILSIANTGIKVVIAAGNDNKQVNLVSPARINHPNVYTVGAIDNIDTYAAFANYGLGVDFSAPGVDILSTYKDGGYAYVSGTSMAAPHMTGVLLVAGSNFTTSGSSAADPTGRSVPVVSH
jgi:subtilisin